jgi:hypothetical protein
MNNCAWCGKGIEDILSPVYGKCIFDGTSNVHFCSGKCRFTAESELEKKRENEKNRKNEE